MRASKIQKSTRGPQSGQKSPKTCSIRKGCDGEMELRKVEEEKNGENSSSLTSLPVDRLNGDRLQRRRLFQLYLGKG